MEITENRLEFYVFCSDAQAMKATATELARDTSRLLAHSQNGKKVEIIKHGQTIATLQSVKTISGERLWRGMQRLTKADRRALRAAIDDGMKAIRD